MSKFVKTYMIIPDVDVDTEMVNYSTSWKKEDMPHKPVSNKRLVEAIDPPQSVFGSYVWYNAKDVKVEWDTLT